MRRLIRLVLILVTPALLCSAKCAMAQGSDQTAQGTWPRQPTLGPGGIAADVRNVNAPKNPNAIPAETYLAANPVLAAKLQKYLPPQLPVLSAATGYNGLSSFAVALHATHDLGIPFSDFKCAELGGKFCTPATKTRGKGFSKALEALRPNLSNKARNAAEKKASQEAKNDEP
jgi:hypothetical protein